MRDWPGIAAYVYESEISCAPCTVRDAKERGWFVPEETRDDDTEDCNGIPYDVEDKDGNPVHPVLCGTEFEYEQACCDCNELIENLSIIGKGNEEEYE